MTLLYDNGLCILLLHLMIGIVVLICFLLDNYFVIVDLLFFNNINIFIKTIFQGRLFGLDSFTNAFFLNKNVLFNGYLASNFISYFYLLIYDLLVMTTYFVYGVEM